MPKAGKNEKAEKELETLTTGKVLKSLSNSEIKERLRDIHNFFGERGGEFADGAVASILKPNGFTKEISRESYIGKAAPQAVQILTAAVIADVCEATKPNFIFPDEKPVMQFLLRQFYHLEKADKDSETYQLMYHVVESIVKSGLLALMATLKQDGDQMMSDLFDMCINKLSFRAEENADVALAAQLADLLKGILDQAQEVTEELLELIIAPLSGKKTKSSAGVKMVKSVVRRLDTPVLQAFCSYIVKNVDKLDASLAVADKASQHEISKKIRSFFMVILALADTGNQHVATTLFPTIAHRLGHTNNALRMMATNAMCKAFEMHTTYYSEYPTMFTSTMRRFIDKNKDIRLVMTEWVVRFLPRHRDTRDTVGSALIQRLEDSENDVKKAALKSVIAIVQTDHSLLPKVVMEKALERIRDKKAPIRRFAMTVLSQMFSEYVEAEKKLPHPFNMIPSALLDVYRSTEPEERREIEKNITHTILYDVDENDGEGLADDSVSRSAAVLVEVWRSLTPTAKETFAKLLRSKKSIRDLVLRMMTLRPYLKKNSEPLMKEQSRAAIHQIIQQLQQCCAISSGLENLLLLKDEAVFKNLIALCQDPEDAMKQKKKTLKAIEASVKGNNDLKALAKNMEVLLVRVAFPIDNLVLKGVVQLLNDVAGVDGEKSNDLAYLLSVLVSSFPEICSEETISSEIFALLTQIASNEADDEGWGGEDESIPVSTSTGKRQKVTTLGQRRSLLWNMLTTLKSLVIADNKVLENLGKSEQTKLSKVLKKLSLNTTEKIAKISVQVLHLTAQGDKAALLNGLADECLKALDPKKTSTHKTLSLFRVLQQCLLLVPLSSKTTNHAAKYVTTVMNTLHQKDIKLSKHHSFRKPPLDCQAYKAALRVFIAYVASLPDSPSVTEMIKGTYKQLVTYLRHMSAVENNIAKAIQTADTLKAILKLGREKKLSKILFVSNTGVTPHVWQTIAFTLLFLTAEFSAEAEVKLAHAEARSEVGRVLHRDIMRGKLPMQFMQLLIMTLVDGNKNCYLKAKERVEECITYFRTKCKQYDVKLASKAAAGLSPEYTVPPLIHLLARWEYLEKLRPSYLPIQRVLFVLFDKLTEVRGCTSFLFDIIGRLKGMDDAVHPASTDTRLICDIAYVVLKQVTVSKQVKVEPFPGMINIPNLFTEADESRKNCSGIIYIDERKFVPVTRKNDRHINPREATIEAEPTSPKQPRKRNLSPAGGRSPGSSSKRVKPATSTATSSPKTGKRKILSDAGEKSKKSSKTPTTKTPATKTPASRSTKKGK